MIARLVALFVMIGAGGLAGQLVTNAVATDSCVDCHTKETPGLVTDWAESRHGTVGIGCTVCHGDNHDTAADAHLARQPTPKTCALCHGKQVRQFTAGKHAKAWTAMTAMPTTHALPMALTGGMKGCGGCHKIGLKTDDEIAALKADGSTFGHASCDSCHTRHGFSVVEARQPQACQTCHQGFDHPQWEMYSGSKHGIRFLLKQNGTLPETTSAPTCQTCHMRDGDHEVRTPWGFLAVRLPLPEDPRWRADQMTILQALGLLDPDGQPTPRLEVAKQADVARFTQAAFDEERAALMAVCGECHSTNFAREELAKADDLLREADHLMANAIRIVGALYADGLLTPPDGAAYAFPDLLTFHDAPTAIESRLFEMFLKHRMRTFQGAFHANPEYALWNGWSEMVRDLTDIREMADQMR